MINADYSIDLQVIDSGEGIKGVFCKCGTDMKCPSCGDIRGCHECNTPLRCGCGACPRCNYNCDDYDEECPKCGWYIG
jgi:hypothetical protein